MPLGQMNKKGFFGYGLCPHCDAFLKEKDLEINTCWSCKKSLEEKPKNKKMFAADILKGIKSGELLYPDWIEFPCASCSLWIPWRELDLDTGRCKECSY